MKIADYRQTARGLFLAALLCAVPVAAQDVPFTRQVEARVFALVNEFRAGEGLRPLEREPRLDDAAGYLSGVMATTARLDHRADGTTPPARVKQRGYAYCELAENIAMEYDSRGFTVERLARAFVQGWRESPTHRGNMLRATTTQTGLGVGRNAQGEYYVTQVFARPRAGGGCR